MMITKKAMPRRTFLRAVGATMALPLLDAMVPAATPLAKTPANPVRRLGFVFMPMGCDITRWTPPGDNLDQLKPILITLAPGPDNLSDFGDFVYSFVSRYRMCSPQGRVQAIEIWNEPNLARERGDEPPNPRPRGQ